MFDRFYMTFLALTGRLHLFVLASLGRLDALAAELRSPQRARAASLVEFLLIAAGVAAVAIWLFRGPFRGFVENVMERLNGSVS